MGFLEFSPSQKYAFLNISIIDDELAEDDEEFLVHLVNPSGGAILGNGSTARVVINNSDDAFGVIELDATSRSKITTEKPNSFNDFTITVS